MVNIMTTLGTGYFGDDILHKLPWLRYLNKSHEIYVASRIDPQIHVGSSLKSLVGDKAYKDLKNANKELKLNVREYSLIYDSTYFKKEYEQDEIKETEKFLGISLRYISSFDRRFYDRIKMEDSRNNKELIQYIVGLTNFFKDFFMKNEINVFITTLEDDIFSVIAYYVAKKLGIEVVGFMSGRFPEKGIFFCRDFNDLLTWSKQEVKFDEIYSLYTDETIKDKKQIDKNKPNFGYNSIKSKIKNINYIKNYRKHLNNIIRNYPYEKFIIEDTDVFKGLNQNLTKIMRVFSLKMFLKEPKYSEKEKYLLFPLHYMEDAQITFREPLLDQFKIISNISRSLPSSHFLYVKPHPHYLGTDVNLKSLKDISKLENIKIINPTEPPIKLIKNATGVITVNSTTGFESLIMGVPLITFGHDFYCKDTLCHIIKDQLQLSSSIMDVITNNSLIDNKIIENFVKKVYTNTIQIEGKKYDSINFTPLSLTESDGKKIAEALNTILNQN